MVFSHPAVDFTKRNVQAPMQAGFNSPVIPDGFGDGGGVVFETVE
jgi:hypothetical protein